VVVEIDNKNGDFGGFVTWPFRQFGNSGVDQEYSISALTKEKRLLPSVQSLLYYVELKSSLRTLSSSQRTKSVPSSCPSRCLLSLSPPRHGIFAIGPYLSPA
jgi:hypothetical protein